MRKLTQYRGLLVKFLVPIAIAVVVSIWALPGFADNGSDYAIANGWFFTQTGGGQGNGYAVLDSGADSTGKPIRFWTEFKRLGGINLLGYPIGQPYVGPGGFPYQPFQRAILQWRPELGVALFANTFEMLQTAGRDDWMLSVKGMPKPIVDDGSGGDYAKAVATRLGWLTNDVISAKYFANPNPQAIASWTRDSAIQLYGLPMSQPLKSGPFIVQRFQRVGIQVWVEDVAGMPAKGSVVFVLGGDLLKEAGLLPASSTQVLGPNGVAIFIPTPTPSPTATPTPPPAPAYPWHVTSIQGWPNCGTTYIRAYTRDANGNGVNGMTLKSWNDWGNEYIASSHNYNGTDGYWDRVIGPGVRAGKWYVMLINGQGVQSSDIATVNFTASCAPGMGNVQEAEVEIRSY